MMIIVNDNVEQMAFSHAVSGSLNWYNHIGKLFNISTKVEYTHTLWPSSPIPKYIPNINVYIYLLKTCTNISIAKCLK